MYQSTWVKASFERASLSGVRPPVFVDRCPGLAEAVDRTGGPAAAEFGGFLDRFGKLLADCRKGST